MTNKDLIEQLNNEIESVELPSRVLDNLLLEMQRKKIQEKAEVKRPRFKFTARMRNSLAVCSVALLMVIAIPIIGSQSEPNLPTLTPNVASFQRLMPNIVEFSDVDTFAKTNVALPMNFAKKYENTTTIFEENGVITLIKQFYLLSDSEQVTIDVDLSDENHKIDKSAKLYDYKNISFALVNQVNGGGYLKFELNGSTYFISFQNIKDEAILTEIVDDIISDIK